MAEMKLDTDDVWKNLNELLSNQSVVSAIDALKAFQERYLVNGYLLVTRDQ